ncbi:hypothetical protein M7784_14730 [Desulfovibrio aminophilus]|nr:hypothetical protein [Desulfovibrio aminophilus]MCM0756488.1 hypothetical protein [Desulfovibrio aminophilus]
MTDHRAGERGGSTLRNLAILVVVAGLFALFLQNNPFEKDIRIGHIGADFFQRSRGEGPLIFSGDLDEARLRLTPEERAKLVEFLQENEKTVKQVEVKAVLQDSYAELRGTTELYVDVVMRMHDGTEMRPPTLRATRDELPGRLLWRVRRDLTAYDKASVKGAVGGKVVIINTI